MSNTTEAVLPDETPVGTPVADPLEILDALTFREFCEKYPNWKTHQLYSLADNPDALATGVFLRVTGKARRINPHAMGRYLAQKTEQ